MPELTEVEIKKAIDKCTIRTLSLDTQVFYKKKYDFNNTSLWGINQFANTNDVTVVLSEIVIREMKMHAFAKLLETQDTAQKSIKNHINLWNLRDELNDELSGLLSLSESSENEANLQIDRYIEESKIKSIPLPKSEIFFLEIIDKYFEAAAPFGNSKDRKHEFPDAYALLSLENWARENNELILCVSDDNGWKSFCKESNYLICVKDIYTTLSYYNISPQNTRDVNRIVEMIKLENENSIDISEEINFYIESQEFYIETNESHNFDFDFLGAELESINFDTISNPLVIASDNDNITFRILLDVSVVASAVFYVSENLKYSLERTASDEIKISLTITTPRKVDSSSSFSRIDASTDEKSIYFHNIFD